MRTLQDPRRTPRQLMPCGTNNSRSTFRCHPDQSLHSLSCTWLFLFGNHRQDPCRLTHLLHQRLHRSKFNLICCTCHYTFSKPLHSFCLFHAFLCARQIRILRILGFQRDIIRFEFRQWHGQRIEAPRPQNFVLLLCLLLGLSFLGRLCCGLRLFFGLL